MIDILKLALIFGGIVLGLRKKVFIGILLFAAGILTALLFRLEFSVMLIAYRDLLLSKDFLYLYGIIIQITFLGRILKEIGYLDRLKKAGDNLIGGARTAAAALPALIGMMPMPGGALLSAPLVGEVLKKDKYSAAFKTAVNYWSRHVIEFCWPVYPGLVLSATITGLPIGQIALLQLPMTLIMIPTGYLFFIRRIDRSDGGRLLEPLYRIFLNIWPIILAIAVYAVFNLPLIFCITIALTVLMIKEKPPWEKTKEALGQGLHPRLLILVVGVLSFQKMLELTGAVGTITGLSSAYGLPPELIIIMVSFTAGLLTGILFALIGLAYPLLAGFLYSPDINLANIFLAFISGYVGMIFSPTHFCLILTNEHFKSNLFQVYKLLTIPLVVLFAAGYLLFKLGYPWNIFN